MGGEKMNKRYEEGRKPGSPPRGRGKVIAQRHALFGVGITPAWAGKSQSSFRAVLLHGDHPRVGGEKFVDESHFYKNLGSPPHGRGKVFDPFPTGLLARITPAWAGKRSTLTKCSQATPDHPRMGGEKLYCIAAFCSMWGSPPRGRGKEEVKALLHFNRGITPAWAGKNPASQPWSPPLWMMVIRPRP